MKKTNKVYTAAKHAFVCAALFALGITTGCTKIQESEEIDMETKGSTGACGGIHAPGSVEFTTANIKHSFDSSLGYAMFSIPEPPPHYGIEVSIWEQNQPVQYVTYIPSSSGGGGTTPPGNIGQNGPGGPSGYPIFLDCTKNYEDNKMLVKVHNLKTKLTRMSFKYI